MEQSFNQSLINISTEYSNLYTSQIRSAVTVDELFGRYPGADASGGASAALSLCGVAQGQVGMGYG